MSGPLRVGYLTTAYPEVSHTFIRREILELERRGHEIVRLSVRRPTSRLVDPLDLEEERRTIYLLARPGALAVAVLAALGRPLRLLRALAMALRMSGRSDRGLLRHLAYVAEACLTVRLLRARGIAHVHVHFATNCAAVARLAHVLGGPPYSMTVHGPNEFDQPIASSLGDKVADAAFTVAISHFCSAQIRRWAAPEHWPRIAIVHCTIGDEYLQAWSPIPPDSKTLLCVGRLAPAKGHLGLLAAFARVAAEDPQAKLVLAGDGELRPAIEREIARLGIGDRVELAGWVDSARVRALLREARAFVLPSFAEGLPVVLMEAFAAGRPVVTTPVAGIPELVEPGVNGWLVPAGDEERLVVALRELLATPIAWLEEMGRAGRDRVLAEHTPKGQVDLLETLLRKAA